MNQEQVKRIKKKIEEEITIINKKINKYKELSKPIAPENSIGRVSRMDAIQNKSVVEAALIEAKKKMKKLTEIKKKNIEKLFTCVKCNNSIPFERLIILPESRLCVKCAQ
tara:strand:+ start:605 stop:934 length:330 start_codon:yes stop_codon:yes gene_type:complete